MATTKEKMMRMIGRSSLLLLAVSLSGAASSGGEQPSPAAITLAGEVVDLHCYLTRGAAGPEHAGCANACIARGVSAGFRADDGRVLLLLAARPFSVKEQLAGLAGSKVKVTGKLVERDGMRAVQLESVERTSADTATTNP